MKISSLIVAGAMASGLFSGAAMANDGPELVEASAPEYPRAAERREIEGHVVVRYSVASTGEVVDVEIVESMPTGVFDNVVSRALEDWRYQASADGHTGLEHRFDFGF